VNDLFSRPHIAEGGSLSADLSINELEQLHEKGEITILSATKVLLTLRVVLSKDYEVEHEKH